MKKNFIKVKEDFVCENCGEKVKGSGYTNHCPKCLYSRHVDLEVPGDRLSLCLGMMKPTEFELKNGKYIIVQKCLKCGKVSKNKISKDDDFEKILKLSN